MYRDALRRNTMPVPEGGVEGAQNAGIDQEAVPEATAESMVAQGKQT